MIGTVLRCLVLLALAAVACRAQSASELRQFFQENIGLNDFEVNRIEQGKAVAKILDSTTPSEVFIFGAVFIQASPSAYVQLAGDLDRFKSLPNYLAIRRFSDAPVLSDLDGFGIDADEIEGLKKCQPGNCELQLPVEGIDAFRSKIDWSVADPLAQVNDLARRMVLEVLLAYQKGGNLALGAYRDKKAPTQVSEQFRDLLSRSSILPEELPAFYSYLLDYPKTSLPGSSNVFYWEKVKFGLKPTLRVNQQTVAHTTGKHGPVDVVAIKQLYASHYFQTALDLSFCVPAQTGGFYLITVKGSEQAGLTGPKGAIVRKMAVDKTRSSLERTLEAVKRQLEH